MNIIATTNSFSYRSLCPLEEHFQFSPSRCCQPQQCLLSGNGAQLWKYLHTLEWKEGKENKSIKSKGLWLIDGNQKASPKQHAFGLTWMLTGQCWKHVTRGREEDIPYCVNVYCWTCIHWIQAQECYVTGCPLAACAWTLPLPLTTYPRMPIWALHAYYLLWSENRKCNHTWVCYWCSILRVTVVLFSVYPLLKHFGF